ncbi:hypothetical protein [Ferrimonas balearica]|uniref:hypothetical protein n=1 Tax=Ferrimonas balearica TaxID=44012 RepID=UPI001C93F719|nr:hypothetical protein [Ferrimonas balearica]MBY5982105.1 hypothetical protein [Ferrimonas balearica]
MNYLIASVLILAVGPLLYHGFRHQTRVLDAIGAFVVVSLFGLVLFDILPELWHHGGFWVVPAILLGFFGPTLAEKAFHRHSRLAHNLTLALGLTGLLVHTLTDGSAIYLVSQQQANDLLALGVVLHNLPAGLAIWWLLRPQFGRVIAAAMLGTLMFFTVVGFFLGDELLAMISVAGSVYLQAFVTGSILHVLVHRPHEHHHEAHHHHDHGHGHRRWRPSRGHYLGSALALIFLVLVMLSHHEHGHHGHLHGDADPTHNHSH